jgi:hypothetical protein
VRDHREDTLKQVPFDISNFGPFAEVPGVAEINLAQQERTPPTPFVAPRAGHIKVSSFTAEDSASFVVRSDRAGVIAQRTCLFGFCSGGLPGQGGPVAFDVETNESVTFEIIQSSGIPPSTIFVFYDDDPTLLPAPLIRRSRLLNIVPSPFLGGYRGWQTTLWNEAIAFAPATLLEDYRTPDDLSEERIQEMSRTAFWPSPSFTSDPFGGPAWYGKGSLAFATANSQNAARLNTFSSPLSAGTQGDLFAGGYARMSCTSSSSAGAGGVLDVSSTFGVPFNFSLTSTKTNTTTDVVDLNGDGVGDVIASKQSILGGIVQFVQDGGIVQDASLGDGFRRRKGFDYSIGLGGKGLHPRTTSGGRKLEESSVDPAMGTVQGASVKVGLGLGRSATTQDLEDINGDGLPDIVSREATETCSGGGAGTAIFVRYNLGQKFGVKERFGRTCVDTTAIDGFQSAEGGSFDTTSNALAHETTLTAHQTASASGLFWEVSVTFRETSSRTTRQLVDLNGDRLPDLLMKSDRGTCGQPVKVQFNLGDRFGSVVDWPSRCWQIQRSPVDPVEVIQLAKDLPAQITLWLGELATDGHALTGPDVLAATGTQGGVSISGSVSIPIIPGILNLDLGGSASRDVDTYEMSLLDIDGDHDADHVLRRKTGSQASNVYIQRNGLSGKSNLLRTVHGPLGGKITLDYARTGNTVAMPQSRHVLTKVEVDDGVPDYGEITSPNLVSTISYGKGSFDRREKEFFGFDKVTIKRADDVTIEQTFDNKSYALHGRLLSESRRDASNRVLQDHRLKYEVRRIKDSSDSNIDGLVACLTTHPRLPADACTPVFAVAVEDTVIRSEGGTLSKTHLAQDLQHDRFGNVLASLDHGDDAITGDEVYATANYRNDTERWILGLPTSLEVRAGGASGEVLRSRRGHYDERGRPDRIEVDVNAGATAVTSIEYDDAGNLTKLTTPPNGSGDGQPQVFTILYDALTESYPAATSDAFGYASTADYDQRFGVATRQVDINGFALTRTLDAFGRLESVSGPYDTAAPGLETQYVLTETPARAVTTTRPHKPQTYSGPTPPTMTSVVAADGLGRTIETRTSAVVGGEPGMTTSGFVSRDRVGNVIKTWHPKFTPGTSEAFFPPVATLATTVSYDALDRQVLMEYPDQARETTTFDIAPDPDGRILYVARHVDANGKPRETFGDQLDRVRAFVEHPTHPDPGAASVTKYDYLATGELALIIDAEGNRTSLSYDRRGLRTSLENGDYGRIEEVYDLMGNRIALIEPNHRANNAQVTFSYQKNRLNKIDYPTKGDVTYGYGAPLTAGGQPGEAGRLIFVDDESSTQEHSYGALGELTRTVRTIKPSQPNQSPLVADLRLVSDSLGRTLSIKYPDGETVTNTFDGGGNLIAVNGAGINGTNVVWSRNYVSQLQYDVFGNRTRTVYGTALSPPRSTKKRACVSSRCPRLFRTRRRSRTSSTSTILAAIRPRSRTS